MKLRMSKTQKALLVGILVVILAPFVYFFSLFVAQCPECYRIVPRWRIERCNFDRDQDAWPICRRCLNGMVVTFYRRMKEGAICRGAD